MIDYKNCRVRKEESWQDALLAGAVIGTATTLMIMVLWLVSGNV